MYDFKIDRDKDKKVHFIGIGGVSMSALAELLLKEGYKVSGSDMNESPICEKLKKDGANIHYGHSEKNIEDADIVIYTDAINLENVELKSAINKKLDVVGRADFLGSIMMNYDYSIAVSGTHGKTTTTSIITEVIEKDKSDPTIMIGGNLEKIHGNIKIGARKLFLTEACEYKANILKYHPSMAVILNIDEDHLDFFDNIEHIIKTFEDYVKSLDENSYLIMNNDDENSKSLKTCTNSKVITFGVEKISDFNAKNIIYNENGTASYDVFKNRKKLAHIDLKILGKHNVYNSLAAFIACYEYGMDPDFIAEKISNYTGVHRRLEFKGMYKGIYILDDYAHHPTEIKASLNAIRNSYSKNIYCVFQPHTYTRTKILLKSFASAFTDADKIIITDIYAAREKDYGDIHSKMLVDAITKNNKDAIYIETFEEVKNFLLKNAKKGDCIVTMGAGDVYKIGENILNK